LQQSFPCPKCGSQIPVGQLFCGTCGQRFEYRCRHCGTAVTSSGFCANCGGKLQHLQQHTTHSINKAEQTYHRKAAGAENTVRQPVGHIGRYFIVLAIILLMVAIVFAVGTSTQGNSSNRLGGYNFGGQSPTSAPPSTPSVTDGTNGQQKPKPVSDSPGYTMDQVIAAAKQLSPDCRLQTARTS
jgi:hypothetical protein